MYTFFSFLTSLDYEGNFTSAGINSTGINAVSASIYAVNQTIKSGNGWDNSSGYGTQAATLNISTGQGGYGTDVSGDVYGGDGGYFNFTTGNGGEGINGGSATTHGGDGGQYQLNSGSGGNAHYGGQGGSYLLTSGSGGNGEVNGSGGEGGDMFFTGGMGGNVSGFGSGTAIGGRGANINFTAGQGGYGNSAAVNVAGNGGSLTFTPGAVGPFGTGVDGSIYFKDAGTTIQIQISTGKVFMAHLPTGAGTPPAGLAAGQLWLDTTLGTHQGIIKIY